jgi:5'(3')-deoxyribonucleotidase
MKKVVIAIDFDDVVVPTAPQAIQLYNKKYGTSIALKDVYSKDLHVWGVESDEDAVERMHAVLRTDEYKTLAPLQETVAVITSLAQQYELHLVTGRSDFLTEATQQTLTRWLPDIFTSVEFTNFFGPNPRSKAEVCRQLGADLLIDDHLHHAEVVAAEGIEVLLFGDLPWNQTADDLPPHITRVSG